MSGGFLSMTTGGGGVSPGLHKPKARKVGETGPGALASSH